MMLGGTSAVTAIGSILQMKRYVDLGILAALGTLFLVLGLHFYRDNGKNYYTRVAMLYGFGFCSGQTLGPLLSYVVSVDPSIIVTALVGTFITFASLSIAALLAGRGQYLFLGGILISVINTMTLLSILNIFFKSMFVQMVSISNSCCLFIYTNILFLFLIGSTLCWCYCYGRIHSFRYPKYC